MSSPDFVDEKLREIEKRPRVMGIVYSTVTPGQIWYSDCVRQYVEEILKEEKNV